MTFKEHKKSIFLLSDKSFFQITDVSQLIHSKSEISTRLLHQFSESRWNVSNVWAMKNHFQIECHWKFSIKSLKGTFFSNVSNLWRFRKPILTYFFSKTKTLLLLLFILFSSSNSCSFNWPRWFWTWSQHRGVSHRPFAFSGVCRTPYCTG